MSILIHWILSALILMAVAYLVPGITIESFWTALVAAVIMGVVNILVKPLLVILTLPVNIISLGLFSFVINALMFALTAWLLPGFEVAGFLSALIGSLLLSLLTIVVGTMQPAH